MRHKLALLTAVVLVGCNAKTDVTEGNSTTATAAKNAEAPYVWESKTFPKQMQISSDFNPGQVAAFQEMAVAWKTAVNNTNFISFGTSTDNHYDISAPDSVMGIYKATTWPDDISDALAITQIFGRRYNVGKDSEYVAIVHADILVNYTPDKYGDVFQFDYDDNDPNKNGYDLRSVVLHEMGHFLGLQHIPKWYDRPQTDTSPNQTAYKASSVMYPSVSEADSKRIPQTKDINALALKYGIGGTTGSAALVAQNALRYQPESEDPGLETKIIMELKKNGDCIHRENGVVIRRHHVKL